MILFFFAAPRRITRYFMGGVLCLFALLAIINIFSFSFYEFGITKRLLYIFLETNPREIKEFFPVIIANVISSIFSIRNLVFLVLSICIYLYIRRLRNLLYVLLPLSAIGLLFIVFAVTNYYQARITHSIFCRITKYSYDIAIQYREARELAKKGRPLPFAESVKSKHLANNIVVIIGESASRNHHQLYDYPLPTTPQLSQISDSLLVYTNAIGSSIGTRGNLERIVSFKNDDLTTNDGYKYPNIIDLFNTAGYKTFWLSNQEGRGLQLNMLSLLIRNSNHILYTGAIDDGDNLINRFDDALIPYVNQALRDSTSNHKLIWVHLLGSHNEYSSRFPKNEAYISAQDELTKIGHPWFTAQSAQRAADYDNSIRFTDKVISQIIRTVSDSNEASIVIYLSDHGENVYDEGNYSGRGRKYVEIPFLIYANYAYRTQNPQLYDNLTKSIDKPISSANLAHTLLTLTGTEYYYYDATNDFMSEDFVFRTRNVDEKPWEYDLTPATYVDCEVDSMVLRVVR